MSEPVKVGKIYAQMSKIMAEVDPIAKDRQGHQYKFRGIDDVYAALQAIMAKHCVFTVPKVLDDRVEERQTKKGDTVIYRVLRIRYRFYADDGSFVDATVIGEGMDQGDKGANKAMSVAHKYCLLQAYCIPTVEPKDPENDEHESSKKVEYYTGADHQKKAIAQAMKAAGVNNQESWIDFAQLFSGCAMTSLPAAIKEYQETH